jgi:hypothetical protein
MHGIQSLTKSKNAEKSAWSLSSIRHIIHVTLPASPNVSQSASAGAGCSQKSILRFWRVSTHSLAKDAGSRLVFAAVKQDYIVKKQRKRKPKKRTPVVKGEFPSQAATPPPQAATIPPQAAARTFVEDAPAPPPAPVPGHRRLWRWLIGTR